MMNINNLLRENIKKLVPYSSARDEFQGSAEVYLDANENAYGSPLEKNYNRYPDPMQMEVKKKLSGIKGILPENILLGNGSDEVIDLLFRAFCNPGIDNVIICPPTYGMYEVSANINDVFVKKVPLLKNFQLDVEGISEVVDERTKLLFICSPNNPSGNSMEREDVEFILNNFEGVVVIDEAYINYSKQKSFMMELTEYPNLVVMQTLSKAWGLAGLRLGMLFASSEIVGVLNKIKPPYNVNQATQEMALKALDNTAQVNEWIKQTVTEREKLKMELAKIDAVKFIFPSDANFLLVKMDDAGGTYDKLVAAGIIVRDRSKVTLCEGCLRITVGTPEQNARLIQEMSREAGQ